MEPLTTRRDMLLNFSSGLVLAGSARSQLFDRPGVRRRGRRGRAVR